MMAPEPELEQIAVHTVDFPASTREIWILHRELDLGLYLAELIFVFPMDQDAERSRLTRWQGLLPS